MSLSNILVPNTLVPYFQNINLPDITLDNTQTHLLALNSSNQLNYVTTGSVLSFGRAFYFRSLTDQMIPTASYTTLAYDTIALSTPNITYNTSSGLFTINTAGVYTFCASTAFAANATGVRAVNFEKNISTPYLNTMNIPPNASGLTSIQMSYTDSFIIGDTLSVEVYQNTGGTLNVICATTNDLNYCNINVTFII
jgi:hypothetical protein